MLTQKYLGVEKKHLCEWVNEAWSKKALDGTR